MAVIHRNLTVAEPAGYRPLHLDLHVPDGDGPFPVLFWIHGGGWQYGSRLQLPDSITPFGLRERYLARGYAVADVDYRLSAEATFPAQLEDVQAAIAWVRGHAAEYGLDLRRFAALGESAGGHLACLAGLRPGPVSGLGAVLSWYSPMDLIDLDRAPDSPEALLLGGRPGALPELARAASPFYQVHPGAPPFQCVHGAADEIVPVSHSERFAGALQAQGVRCDLIVVPGADHCFVGYDDIGSLIDAGIDFLDEVLAGD